MHICCFLFFFLEDSEDSLACFRRIAHPRIAHPSESINSGRDSELLLTSSGQGYLTSLGRTNLLLLLSILLSFLLLLLSSKLFVLLGTMLLGTFSHHQSQNPSVFAETGSKGSLECVPQLSSSDSHLSAVKSSSVASSYSQSHSHLSSHLWSGFPYPSLALVPQKASPSVHRG